DASHAAALASPQDLVRQLGGCAEALPEALRRQLLAVGAAIVPALITLVEQALTDDHAALGWAPLHAVELLGALGDPRAVPVLRRCLAEDDESDLLDQQVVTALRALGARALDACVAAYATTPQDAFRDRVAGVLSQWGSHDERIYAVLVDTLQRTPELGANYLVDYGDVRALDVLAQTFDALPIREGANPLANHVFIALRCAIEELGSQLTAAQRHKCAQAEAARRRLVAQLAGDVEALAPSAGRAVAGAHPATERPRPRTTGQRKLGRNAPCWCGSG